MTEPDPILTALTTLGLRAGMTVLDAGCGDGALLAALARHVAPESEETGRAGTVVGIDASQHALDTACRYPTVRDLIDRGVVRLRTGDLHRLPDEEATYDAVWSSSVLHHVADPGVVVAGLARLVRPGGVVAILDGDNSGSFPFLPWPADREIALRIAVWRAAADDYGDRLPYTFHGYAGREVVGWMRAAGLDAVTVHPVTVVDRFPLSPARRDELLAWFTGPFLERIVPYLAPVDSDWFRACFAPDGPSGLLDDPDFFMLRTSLLTVGHRP